MPPLSNRSFYTTGEMARVLGVAQQTVIRRIDAGKLKAYRLPGGDRRCSKSVFSRYLKQRRLQRRLTNPLPKSTDNGQQETDHGSKHG